MNKILTAAALILALTTSAYADSHIWVFVDKCPDGKIEVTDQYGRLRCSFDSQ